MLWAVPVALGVLLLSQMGISLLIGALVLVTLVCVFACLTGYSYAREQREDETDDWFDQYGDTEMGLTDRLNTDGAPVVPHRPSHKLSFLDACHGAGNAVREELTDFADYRKHQPCQ